MPERESLCIVDITSGLVLKLLTYLEAVAKDLGNPPELASIFPQGFRFDFSRIRVSVQLSQQRLRYEEARQRERERAAGRWDEEELRQRYARRSLEEYEAQSRGAVQEWEQVRGDVHQPRVGRAIILGDPGFGKSWLLRYEGCTLAEGEIARLQRSEVGTAGVLVPVFARLARLAEQKGPLLARLRAVLAEQGVPCIEELWGLIAKKAEIGQTVLLLDGWDEVREGREKLKETLETFVRQHPQCRLYLTSRIAGYVPLNLSTREWELVSFSPKQIQEFVRNFFGTPPQQENESGPEERAQKGAALHRALQQRPQVTGLARIPLMLALLCRLYWEKETLPARRADIYKECLWGLMRRWKKEGEDDPIEAEIQVEDKLTLLADLALQLLQTSPQADAWSLRELTEWVRKVPEGPRTKEEAARLVAELVQDGVLVREGEGERAPLRFLHLTFQEYLVASALAKRPDWPEVVEHWLAGFWEPRAPVVELLAGELEHASPLVDLLLSHDDSRPLHAALRRRRLGRDPFGNVLLLAARCVAEARKVSPSSMDTLHRRAELRLRRPYRSLQGRAVQALAWLGQKWQKAFDRLCQALHDTDWHVRGAASRALGQLGDTRAVEPLRQALETWGRLEDVPAVERLRPALLNEFFSVGIAATEALRQLGDVRTVALYQALHDADLSVRKAARDVWAGTPLRQALLDESQSVREAAPEALGQLRNARAVERLCQTLLEVISVPLPMAIMRRRGAAQTLGRLGDVRAGTPLRQALLDESQSVREAAAEALGQLGDARAVESLRQALLDESQSVREAAAIALEKIERRMREEAERQKKQE